VWALPAWPRAPAWGSPCPGRSRATAWSPRGGRLRDGDVDGQQDGGHGGQPAYREHLDERHERLLWRRWLRNYLLPNVGWGMPFQQLTNGGSSLHFPCPTIAGAHVLRERPGVSGNGRIIEHKEVQTPDRMASRTAANRRHAAGKMHGASCIMQGQVACVTPSCGNGAVRVATRVIRVRSRNPLPGETACRSVARISRGTAFARYPAPLPAAETSSHGPNAGAAQERR
jgi:hypothetical protein